MDNHDKTYGTLRDGTVLTDSSAEELVVHAFDTLNEGKGTIKKSPRKQVRLRLSVSKLPPELQEAAFYK